MVCFIKKTSLNKELNDVVLEHQHSSTYYSIYNQLNSNDQVFKYIGAHKGTKKLKQVRVSPK